MNGPIAEVHPKVERLALKDRPKSTDGARKYCSLDPFLGDGGKTGSLDLALLGKGSQLRE